MQIYKLILLSLSIGYGYQYLIDLLVNLNLTRKIPRFLIRKPFTCVTCLTMWSALILTVFNLDMVFYIIPAGIITEAINRHLKTKF